MPLQAPILTPPHLKRLIPHIHLTPHIDRRADLNPHTRAIAAIKIFRTGRTSQLRASFDRRHGADSRPLFDAPESPDAEVVAGSGVGEDDGAPRETVEEDVEPAVAGNHGAGDAEVGVVDLAAGHGCDTAGGEGHGANGVDGGVEDH